MRALFCGVTCALDSDGTLMLGLLLNRKGKCEGRGGERPWAGTLHSPPLGLTSPKQLAGTTSLLSQLALLCSSGQLLLGNPALTC